ncbi:30S ribosomal protein S8 [Alcanivorax sp. 97CO-5]|jgi:small subunit ribosomal protein S8|uniref:Small ribosomal subunit protein uS8 n=1 Tax=Alcanivorax borkumensis (strain ATCC 700651 / DSM 11573 / NCIMB 13689 / SK2) TaxID=393595 RepID=RS8_ALCBS|nr:MULTISPECIES: 30S ribosomal protein S8 [Alcanivorax]Q0VSI9.1 RecName: Full=Small ribosomal subunit protein uS8; AltName: Full=30S ribosomal protein S8 [Alcanivorax borkumensis SK2]EUC68181.1 30S ribosomal protein S8 [Alcanivorax sp. 97CO-5]PKG00551.1 30S ribosomal protein S8 [Alcanivorax sp. 97CO-6]CAL15859.1 30S ribosomal protein S8 [Alcanivorax borkumensis SK2]BAP13276.1 30S ribosomal protein S8 [Alcanivorax sp. NBRC 101098]
MSMQDTLADMFTRIRNAQMAKKVQVEIPASKAKEAVAKVLKDEGYIAGYEVTGDKKPVMTVELKYYEGSPVIEKIARVSRPGLRVYKSAGEIPKVKDGLGVMIVSTNQGIISDRAARKANIGGELICEVS